MSIAVVRSVSGESLTQELEAIFREHYQLVYRAAYGITGNRQDAEDVLQTIFVRLIQRKNPPDLLKNPKGYLYRAAINLSLNVVRARKRDATHDVEELEALAHPAESIADDPFQRLLRDAISQLKPNAVEMLSLRYMEGCSDAQIAKMLGKSRGVVAVTLYRARARLKKLLRRAIAMQR